MSDAVENFAAGPDALAETWELAASGTAFVPWLVREFVSSGIPREDLESEARLGLFDAALRFDSAHGVRFVTYASFWARRRMQTLVLRQARIVRRPAARPGAAVRFPRDVSLDDPVGPDPRKLWRDVLEDGAARPPLDLVLEDERQARLARAIEGLPQAWRYVLERRYGLDGGPPRTLAWLGVRMGLSRERVRQLERKGLARLRDALDRAT